MKWIRPFLAVIGLSRLATAGAAIVTSAFIADLILIIGEKLVFVSNPYIGMIAYLVFPGLFVFGLILIPIGIWLRLRRLRRPLTLETTTRLVNRGVIGRPAPILRVVVLLTLVNLLVLGIVGYRGFHYMESTAFCGQLCHEVMHPEFTAYQDSPHAEVECVQCHIGPGADWFVRSKLSGARQVLAVTFDTYHKPVHTPIENLRPAREVCEVCHRPDIFHGNLIKTVEHFAEDRDNTRTYTVLNLRVGGIRGHASGIHWHVDEGNELRYYATDDQREKIVWIEQTLPDGTRRVWKRPNSELTREQVPVDEMRTMDCVDCHNRPTHIFYPPREAIERRMVTGDLDPAIPWIRKVAEQVLTREYETSAEAMKQIELRTIQIYRRDYPEVWREHEPRIRDAIEVLRQIHQRNVFPEMNIQWNTYTSLIGHPDEHSARCFRCHDGMMRDQAGKQITIDCQSCHYLLASDAPDPSILKILRGEPTLFSGVEY